MRKHRTAVAETVATLDPTLPAGCRPLKPGKWPAVRTKLHISGVRGAWAYCGHMECGRDTFVLILPDSESASLWDFNAGWYVARIDRVFVLADGTEEGAQ